MFQKFAILGLVLTMVAGCMESNPHPAKDYPEPFYGQLFYEDALISATPQQITARVIGDSVGAVQQVYMVPSEMAQADTPQAAIMELPIDAGIDNEGKYLYVMEKNSFKTNKYDLSTGELSLELNTAAENKATSHLGKGIRVMSDDELWIHGVDAGKVFRITPQDELLGYWEGRSGDSFIKMTSGALVQTTSSNEHELFHVFDTEGEKQRSFGILSSYQIEIDGYKTVGHGLGFHGWTTTNGDDSFIHVANMGGGLLSFNTDGSLRYFREFVEHVPFPGTVPTGENTRGIDMDGVHTQHMALNVWEDVYYEYAINVNSGERIIDAYDYNTGDYLSSIPHPEGCWVKFVTDSEVYAMCENGFSKLERVPLEDDMLNTVSFAAN